MKRKIRIIVLTLCLTLIQPLNVFAGGLINDGIGFRYINMKKHGGLDDHRAGS